MAATSEANLIRPGVRIPGTKITTVIAMLLVDERTNASHAQAAGQELVRERAHVLPRRHGPPAPGRSHMIDMAVSQSLTARLAVGVRAGKRAAGRDGHERTRTVPMRLGKRAALALLGRRN